MITCRGFVEDMVARNNGIHCAGCVCEDHCGRYRWLCEIVCAAAAAYGLLERDGEDWRMKPSDEAATIK